MSFLNSYCMILCLTLIIIAVISKVQATLKLLCAPDTQVRVTQLKIMIVFYLLIKQSNVSFISTETEI